MAPNVSLLTYDGTTPFTVYNFGNLLAGTPSQARLAFAYSDGTVTATGTKFGAAQVSGSDGYTFTEVAAGQTFNSSGTSLSGSAILGVGSITGTATLRYGVTVTDLFGYESDIDAVTLTPSFSPASGNTFGVPISWTAISGAYQYGLYLSTNSGATYGRIGFFATTTHTDTSGTSDVATPPASGTSAYRASGTWFGYTSYLALGDLASGTKMPVFFRENVPSGTTSAANTRQVSIFTSCLV